MKGFAPEIGMERTGKAKKKRKKEKRKKIYIYG